MGKNHLLNYIVAGIIAVYSIPVLAQNELEVTSESDGAQIRCPSHVMGIQNVIHGNLPHFPHRGITVRGKL